MQIKLSNSCLILPELFRNHVQALFAISLQCTLFGNRIGTRKWNRGQLWSNNLAQSGAALCSISGWQSSCRTHYKPSDIQKIPFILPILCVYNYNELENGFARMLKAV